MTYLKKKAYENVFFYSVDNARLVLVNESNRILAIEDEIETIIKELKSKCLIKLMNNGILVSDPNNCIENWFLNTDGSVKIDFSALNCMVIDIFSSKDHFVKFTTKQNTTIIYNLLSGRVSEYPFKSGLFGLFNEEDHFLLKGKSGVIIRNNKWESDLSHYGKLRMMLGMFDSDLWILIDPYKFICLNIKNGEIVDDWNPFEGIFEAGRFYFNFPYFEEANGKVLFFERDCFIECNLKSQETKILWQDKSINLNIISPHFTDEYVYFSAATRSSVFSTIIGVFDRKKNQVIWQEEIKLEAGISLKEPQVSGNKLYVLDTGGTLHIFEKET
jgi:hypothetical protein